MSKFPHLSNENHDLSYLWNVVYCRGGIINIFPLPILGSFPTDLYIILGKGRLTGEK